MKEFIYRSYNGGEHLLSLYFNGDQSYYTLDGGEPNENVWSEYTLNAWVKDNSTILTPINNMAPSKKLNHHSLV